MFGSPEVYINTRCVAGDSAKILQPWLRKLWQHLAEQCELFPQLQKLLALRVPDPGPKDDGVPRASTPLAQALAQLVLRPLATSVAGGSEGNWYKQKILESLLSGLLGDCPQASGVDNSDLLADAISFRYGVSVDLMS